MLFPLTVTKNCPFHYIRQLTYVMKWTIFCSGQRKQQIHLVAQLCGVAHGILRVFINALDENVFKILKFLGQILSLSPEQSTLDEVTHSGLVPACCHLQFSAVTTVFFHVDVCFVGIQKSSQSYLPAAILSCNNFFHL
jgi:hypothetical protein